MGAIFFLVPGKIQNTVIFKNSPLLGGRGVGGSCLEDDSAIGQASGGRLLATAQLLEVTVLVSVTC